jgi:hypothetical protein
MTRADLEREEDARTASNLWATAAEVRNRYHMARGSVKGGVVEAFMSLPAGQQFFSVVADFLEPWLAAPDHARSQLPGHGLFSALATEAGNIQVGRKFMQYSAGADATSVPSSASAALADQVAMDIEQKQAEHQSLFSHHSKQWAGVPQPLPDAARLPALRYMSLDDTVKACTAHKLSGAAVLTDQWLPSAAVDRQCVAAGGTLTSSDPGAIHALAESLAVEDWLVRDRVLHEEQKALRKQVAKTDAAIGQVSDPVPLRRFVSDFCSLVLPLHGCRPHVSCARLLITIGPNW